MNLLPRTAFARTALAIALTLFLAQLLMLLSLRIWLFAPAAERMAGMLAEQAQLIERLNATGLATELLKQSLIRLHPGQKSPPGGAPKRYYQRIFETRLRASLGPEMRYRVQQGDELLLWVHSHPQAAYWVGLPMQQVVARSHQMFWFWLLTTVALALLTGALLARSLTAPLRRLIDLTQSIGRGERPVVPPAGGSTEVRELAHALVRMTEDFDQASTERELLLAGISHDLRTPLTRMRLTVEWLAGEATEQRDSLIAEIEEIDDMIGHFLASVRAGREEAVQCLDLSLLIQEVVAGFSRTGVAPVLELDDLPQCSLRPLAMRRVLNNLLENARRHGAPPILVRAERHAGGIRMRILDRGAGLSEARIAGLFQPFAPGARGGTGLGLFTARRLVRLHGGELSLHPRPGGGLEARIELPAPKG